MSRCFPNLKKNVQEIQTGTFFWLYFQRKIRDFQTIFASYPAIGSAIETKIFLAPYQRGVEGGSPSMLGGSVTPPGRQGFPHIPASMARGDGQRDPTPVGRVIHTAPMINNPHVRLVYGGGVIANIRVHWPTTKVVRQLPLGEGRTNAWGGGVWKKARGRGKAAHWDGFQQHTFLSHRHYGSLTSPTRTPSRGSHLPCAS